MRRHVIRAVPAADTTVAPAAAVTSVAGDPAARRTVVLAPGATAPSVGGSLVVPAGGQGDGVVGRVAGLQALPDGSTSVAVDPAGVDAAYQLLQVSTGGSLGDSDVEVADDDANPLTHGLHRPLVLHGTSLHIGGTGVRCTGFTGPAPPVDITVDLTPLHWDLSFTYPSPSIHFLLTGSPVVKVNLGLGVATECHWTLPLHLVIPIPGTPLQVRVSPRLQLNTSGRLSGSFTWSPRMTYGFDEGNGIHQEVHVFNPGSPTVQFSADAKADVFLGAQADLTLGGRVGVSASFGPDFAVSRSLSGGKWCTDASVGLKIEASVDADVFIAHWNFPLWSGLIGNRSILHDCSNTSGGSGSGGGGGSTTPPGGGGGGTTPPGGGGSGGGGGPGGGLGSVTISNNNGQMAVQVVNFPTGLTPYFCHAGSGPDYPTGGTVTAHGQVNITSSNQSWASGLCSGGHSTNMWIGFQGTDGHDYYSNQVVIDVAASPGAGVSISNNNGQMAVQVVNFPTGLTPYFCHAGSGPDYPTGGTVTAHGQVNITSSNQSWASGLCSGGHSTNMWIGFQGTDGHDYYSNQVVIDVAASPGAAASVFGSNGQMSLQLTNFPTGTNYYFCHQGDPSQYPTGGTIIGHGQLGVSSPNGTYGPLCSGSGNAWIGVQGADGHDYYTNQITL